MRRVDTIRMAAPVARVFAAAAEVTAWPRRLHHYRSVEVLEPGPGVARVRMRAVRPFGPLRFPVWWEAEMWSDPSAGTVRYRHVRGVTAGMEVEWRLTPVENGTEVSIVHEWRGPRWPVVGPAAARWIIGPVFVSGIAERTLAGLRDVVEASAGNPLHGDGLPRPS